MTTRRIHNEYKEMLKNPPANCSAGPVNDTDIFSWSELHFNAGCS